MLEGASSFFFEPKFFTFLILTTRFKSCWSTSTRSRATKTSVLGESSLQKVQHFLETFTGYSSNAKGYKLDNLRTPKKKKYRSNADWSCS